MRISDWSSDVCSSDLRLRQEALDLARARDDQLIFFRKLIHAENGDDVLQRLILLQRFLNAAGGFVMLLADDRGGQQIGRAHVELQSLMRNSYAVFRLTNKNDTLSCQEDRKKHI